MSLYDYRYSIKVVSEGSMDGHSRDGALTTGCLVRVYDVGTVTASTIYSDKKRTSKSATISRTQFSTDEGIEFYSASTSHDISVAYSDGSVQRYYGVTPTTKTLVLNRSDVSKCMIAQYAANTDETDTGLDFPLGAVITDIYLKVITTDATETIDVGLLSTESGGDANGFASNAAVSGSNESYLKLFSYTTGGNETYLSTVNYGALFNGPTTRSGTDVAKDTGVPWVGVKFITAATSLTYTCSAGTDTAAGFIYVPFYTGF